MNLAIKSALTLGSMLGAKRIGRVISQLELDDFLGIVGLERRPSALATTLPAVGLVALGAIVGAGAALALAPCSGQELRQRLSGKVTDAKARLESAAAEHGVNTRGHSQTVS